MGALVNGFTMVLARAPSPEVVFPLIERERVTHTFAVPAMLVQWLASSVRRTCELHTLDAVLSGGAKVVPELARQVRPALGCRLANAFGMAEGFVASTRPDDPDEVIWETVGRPLSPDDEFRIVDDDGHPLEPGATGELEVRGPYTVRGYYRAPEINREAFTADGFYRTGDMLRVDQHGDLIVEGRKKDLINRGGEKISSEEIENLLLGHPKIQNVAVVAMPDAVMGERACAFVVPRPGDGFTLTEITAFLHEKQIARFKFPERLEVVERFPLTSVGKVSKKGLREEIARKLENERAVGLTR
jgi:2,3-dihydroxybenzoate-AMP ligase